MVRLREWLLIQLKQNRNTNLLFWQDRKQKIVAIKWKHASYQDYEVADSHLFREWAVQNGHLDTSAEEESREEMKRWKTNFRCALQSAVNVVRVDNMNKKQSKQHRFYKLLDAPDPDKLQRKRKENKNAIKSKRKPKEQRRRYRSRKVGSRVRNESETTGSELDTCSSDEASDEMARPAVVQLHDEAPPVTHAWKSDSTEALSAIDHGYSSDDYVHYDTLQSEHVAMEVGLESSSVDSDYGSCDTDDDYERQVKVWSHCGIIQETNKVVVERINSVELGLQFTQL